jgi:hypothetical protein
MHTRARGVGTRGEARRADREAKGKRVRTGGVRDTDGDGDGDGAARRLAREARELGAQRYAHP